MEKKKETKEQKTVKEPKAAKEQKTTRGTKAAFACYEKIRKNEEIRGLIQRGNEVLGALGYTEHSEKHAAKVADTAGKLLKELGATDRETELAMIAGYMDESTGTAVDPVSAALILADKTDVRRNRVRNKNRASFDAHDRVNYAVLSAKLSVRKDKKIIQMDMELDDSMCTVMDYFEIFLERMLLCRRAAEFLGLTFKLDINGLGLL